MHNYKMAFKKTKYANLYFKDILVINILKASLSFFTAKTIKYLNC